MSARVLSPCAIDQMNYKPEQIALADFMAQQTHEQFTWLQKVNQLDPGISTEDDLTHLFMEARIHRISRRIALLVVRQTVKRNGIPIADRVVIKKAHVAYTTGQHFDQYSEDEVKPWGKPPPPTIRPDAIIPRAKISNS